MPDFHVSHSWDEETPEAKAKWFQSLSFEERFRLFCGWTEMMLALNPHLMEQKDAQPVPGRIQVLRKV